MGCVRGRGARAAIIYTPPSFRKGLHLLFCRSIDAGLVEALVGDQFPQWAALPVRLVTPGGWDNRSFRVGDELVVRLPSDAAYAAQVAKEHEWLPRLAPRIPFATPGPVAMGRPGRGYPWSWSIYRWIPGETPLLEVAARSVGLAVSVARFLVALHGIDARAGPAPGSHNFFRGGPLVRYDAQVRAAIAILGRRLDVRAASAFWEAALGSEWSRAPRWVHGDVAAGNLLLRDGELHAVIDFGGLAVGDPACDLAVAWTMFEEEARERFKAALDFDDGTWARARGWALWKALIVAAGVSKTNAIEFRDPWRVIDAALGVRDPQGRAGPFASRS